MYQTVQEKKRQTSLGQKKGQFETLESQTQRTEDLTMQLFTPMSERGRGMNKDNALQRTASLDFYLSNGTTFLKGQRFLSPCSTQKGNDSFVTKHQVQTYFAKLICKKLSKLQQGFLQDGFEALKTQQEEAKFHEKISILNLVREFIMKQEAFKVWREF